MGNFEDNTGFGNMKISFAAHLPTRMLGFLCGICVGGVLATLYCGTARTVAGFGSNVG